MLQFFKYIIPLILIFSGFATIDAQFCRNYEQQHCSEPPADFVNGSVSRAFTLGKDHVVRFNQILYGGRTYFLSVCGEKKLGNIEFRLLADDEAGTVLYSNSSNGFIGEQTFQIENSIKLVIEILAPDYSVADNHRCAGLKIYYK
ncbi:hypothetical protein [Alkalitalea saponilacus]|uniref:Uncharacterized protein n=1 Tax=Alkalitalea saponilacus TaxID=889453 RepID=A0A1T5BSZ5_9BACT|nr:hypothetical protein [Alkalitalea saponilacus]ASB49608.1 hypothetical protein CDL62_10865 [Alkalitalea saponilacus]SKB50345.1 hypothetical protein SAMN03080601_00614 [Alkalitalea saponilacus]